MKKFRALIFVGLLCVISEARAEINYGAYYQALNAGNYSASVSVASNDIKNKENHSKKNIPSTIQFAFTVAMHAIKAGDFATYNSVRPVIDSAWKNSHITSFQKTRFAILADVLHISNRQLTKENRRQIRDQLANVSIQSFLSEDEEVHVYNQLARFSIEEKEYTDAERYALNGLSVAAGRGHVFPETLYENLTILARMYNSTGRRANNQALGSALTTLENQNLIPGRTPGMINSVAEIVSILVETGKLEGAEQQLSSLDGELQSGTFVPVEARANLLYSRALIAAFKGQTHFFDNIQELIGKHFGDKNLYKNKDFDSYRLMQAYSRINSGAILNDQELVDLDKLEITEDAEIFRQIARIVSSKNSNDTAIASSISNLKKHIIAFNNATYSEYLYEKAENIFTTQIQNALFAYLQRTYGRRIPKSVSRAALEFLFQTETLKVDYLSKVKSISSSFVDKKSKFLIDSYYKLVEEKNILIGKLISAAVNQAQEFVTRKFKHIKVENDQISFRFKDIARSIDSILRYLQDRENYNGKQTFSSSEMTLNKVELLLGDNADLLFYRPTDSTLFTCIISNNDHSCSSISLNGTDTEFHVNTLYNAASNPPNKNQEFPDESAEHIYKLLLGNYAPHKDRLLLIKPAAGDLKLPYRALRSDEWDTGEYLGLKTNVSFLSSLFSTPAPLSSSENLKEYLGVGDPQFQQDNSEQIKMSGLFTIRSASMANELAALLPLPDTKNEILRASQILSENEYELLLGPDASELKLRLAGPHRFRVLHFATHGLVTGEFTGLERPSLALSSSTDVTSDLEDGLLTSNEIAEFRLQADLVILSACQTVTDFGQPNTFGFNGLTSAFLRAGAQSVLGTQWKIESKSAATYISKVVSEIISADSGAGNANSEAARHLAREKGYQHPFYWAPYVIVQGWPNNQKLKENKTTTDDLAPNSNSSRHTEKLREVNSHYSIGPRPFVTVMDTKYGNDRVNSYFGEYSNNEISLKKSEFGSLGIFANDGDDLIFRAARFEESSGITPIIGKYNFDAGSYLILYEFDDYPNSISIFNSAKRVAGGFLIKATAYTGVDGDKLWQGYIQLDDKFNEIRRFSDDLDTIDTYNDHIIRNGNSVYRISTRHTDKRGQGYSLKLGYNRCIIQYDIQIDLFDPNSGTFIDHQKFTGFSREAILPSPNDDSVIFKKSCGNQRYFIWNPGDKEPVFFSNMPLDIWSANKFVSKAGSEFLFLNTTYQISNLHKFGLPSEYISIDKTFSNKIKSGIKDAYMAVVLKKDRNKYMVVNAESGRLLTMYSGASQVNSNTCVVYGVKNRNLFETKEFAC